MWRKDATLAGSIVVVVATLISLIVDRTDAGSCSSAKLCCQGRDSGCVIQKESPNAIIESPRDKPCYCDHACLKLADCCDDFKETCGVVDCAVSQWSSWSQCDNGCGSGTQRRSRVIEISEKNGGKHCPRLDQVRTCRSFQTCHAGIRPQPHAKSVTLLALFPGDGNSTDVRIKDRIVDKRGSCVAFTIVRVSQGCSKISDLLSEGMRTYDDFLSVSVYCRDHVNPEMFVYALSVAILHRPDTKDLPIPPLSEIFPYKYIDGGILARAKENANVVPAGFRLPIEIPRDYTASDLDDEHRVAYWREDIGLNLHHWHWHLVYPYFQTDKRIVNKDRRGELFYYMHHQIVARYNVERLCNRLSRVKRFHNWREPISEGYFPKLDSLVASRTWPARPAGAVLKDINRPVDQLDFDLQDLERWRDRIYEAIHTGAYINLRNEKVPLTEFGGVDVLGNIMEASILSPNHNFYGDLHNFGHNAISYCHDPDHRYLEFFSIMGDPATAMRDPIFYRFHAFLDDVFLEHKNTLPEYSLQQLDFPGVEITDIEVQTPNQPANVLSTFWNKSDVDLSRGLDFTPRGPVLVRFTHMNHSDFKYRIVANNRNNAERRGTVRIFMAPRQDERGLPYVFRDQKELMIEMDKFTVLLRPGQNTIERKSTESSVTIPFERTFRNLNESRPSGGESLEQYNFCGCGWPQHMLIPKGKEEGFPMDLFIMISDYTVDAVEQDESPAIGCKDAVSYCGLRDRKYPDARPMGYPFDRRARAGVETLAQFLTGNMARTHITIRHTDTVLPRVRS